MSRLFPTVKDKEDKDVDSEARPMKDETYGDYRWLIYADSCAVLQSQSCVVNKTVKKNKKIFCFLYLY